MTNHRPNSWVGNGVNVYPDSQLGSKVAISFEGSNSKCAQGTIKLSLQEVRESYESMLEAM